MELLRERNTATTIYFPIRVAGSADFATSSDWTPASGDVQYMVDGGTPSSTNSLPSYEGAGIWSLALLATEVNGKVTTITIIDSATKAVDDQAILIQTWGDDSAGLPLNAFADFLLNRNMATARASSRGDQTGRFILQAFARLRNKVARSTNIDIYEENDTTIDWSMAFTSSGSAEVITSLDPTT